MEALTDAQMLASAGAAEAWSFVLNFLVLIILSIALFVFAYRYGKGALLSLIASFYVGFAVYTVFPYKEAVAGAAGGAAGTTVASIVIFLAFSFFAYYIIRKFSDGVFILFGNAGVFVLALLASGFLIALSYHTFAIQDLYRYTPAIETYFTPAKYFFWWFIAPLLGLIGLAR